MFRIIFIAGTLALSACVPPPASAPVRSDPIIEQPEPFYKNLPQWKTMCEQQPDSPACYCLNNKADPQCQN